MQRADTGTALTKKAEPQAVENYLLVGSDTREGADPNSADFGAIGNEGAAPGRRSDTIMVLRFDPKTGAAAILSIPRDLWVPIAGTGESNRINSAYTKGNDVLIETVEQNLGIPINHFIDVDFYGFKDLVDALGGVTVYFDLPTRDKNTGLRIDAAGLRHPRRDQRPALRALPPLLAGDQRQVEGGPVLRLRPHQPPAGLHPQGRGQGVQPPSTTTRSPCRTW